MRHEIFAAWLSFATLVACGGTPDGQGERSEAEPGGGSASEAEVGESSQALGGWRTLSDRDSTPVHMGPTFTLLQHHRPNQGSGCMDVDVLLTATGERLDVPSPDVCGSAQAGGSDATGLFVYFPGRYLYERGSIFSLRQATDLEWYWVEMTDSPVTAWQLLPSATHLYFETEDGIQRVSRSVDEPQTPTTIAANRSLVGIDGQYLYAIYYDGDYDLRRMSLTGRSETTLLANGPYLKDATFDSTNFYFTQDSGGTSRIRHVTPWTT